MHKIVYTVLVLLTFVVGFLYFKASYDISGSFPFTQEIILIILGSIYSRGAKSAIESFDLYGLKLPEGGELRVQIMSASPESMKRLGEFFEVLANVVQTDANTEVRFEILDPQDDCPFVQELRKGREV
jgi:hypothetical protein